MKNTLLIVLVALLAIAAYYFKPEKGRYQGLNAPGGIVVLDTYTGTVRAPGGEKYDLGE